MDRSPVLVIAPHPGDEALGCGGTITRLSREGRSIHILVMCGADTARSRELQISAQRSATLLGAHEPDFLAFPENRTDTVALFELAATMEHALRKTQAATVFAPHPGSLNLDHRRSSEAAAIACRPSPGQTVRELLLYEIVSSTDWSAGPAFAPFVPNHFVDIAGTIDCKIAAISAYGSEVRMAPHARSPEAVRALAVHRGMGVGLAAAEAFVTARRIIGPEHERS
jgi:N-acetylglucosamine malate deacetylase 1